jgi:hypothetical protein
VKIRSPFRKWRAVTSDKRRRESRGLGLPALGQPRERNAAALRKCPWPRRWARVTYLGAGRSRGPGESRRPGGAGQQPPSCRALPLLRGSGRKRRVGLSRGARSHLRPPLQPGPALSVAGHGAGARQRALLSPASRRRFHRAERAEQTARIEATLRLESARSPRYFHYAARLVLEVAVATVVMVVEGGGGGGGGDERERERAPGLRAAPGPYARAAAPPDASAFGSFSRDATTLLRHFATSILGYLASAELLSYR